MVVFVSMQMKDNFCNNLADDKIGNFWGSVAMLHHTILCSNAIAWRLTKNAAILVLPPVPLCVFTLFFSLRHRIANKKSVRSTATLHSQKNDTNTPETRIGTTLTTRAYGPQKRDRAYMYGPHPHTLKKKRKQTIQDNKEYHKPIARISPSQ